jgi:hypothetical protein
MLKGGTERAFPDESDFLICPHFTTRIDARHAHPHSPILIKSRGLLSKNSRATEGVAKAQAGRKNDWMVTTKLLATSCWLLAAGCWLLKSIQQSALSQSGETLHCTDGNNDIVRWFRGIGITWEESRKSFRYWEGIRGVGRSTHIYPRLSTSVHG